MKTIGIIGAMAEEIALIRNHLLFEKQDEIVNLIFYQGQYADVNVVIVQSGIGKVNATIAATLLIERFRCEAIINTGSAGALSDDLSVGDVVIADKLIYHDADARAFGYQYGQVPQMPPFYKSDERLKEIFITGAEKSHLNIRIGEILTGDSFISSNEKKNIILDIFPQALVTEMEGTAIAQTAFQFNVPAIVIRAVSDTANNEANQSFDEFIIEAGKRSGQMVLEALKLIEV